MSTGKASRWLDLLAYLLPYHFGVTREQIFGHVGEYAADLEAGKDPESVRRKFERDKDELRAIGIEIETVTLSGAEGDESRSGYRLRPSGFYLPYLELREGPTAAQPVHGVMRIAVTKQDLAMLDRATRRVTDSAVPVLAAALGPTSGATSWVSATPFVPPRHLKRHGRSSLGGQIEAELEVRGLSPAEVQVLEWTGETLAFRQFVRRRQQGPQPPADVGFAVRLHFNNPVVGPVCLGYGSHYGLGRFAAR
jgi:hypothetical protein